MIKVNIIEEIWRMKDAGFDIETVKDILISFLEKAESDKNYELDFNLPQ